MGGIFATAIATPVLIVCCGGGGTLLVATIGMVSGWLSGLSGVAVLMVTAGVALAYRVVGRRAKSDDRCVPAVDAKWGGNG